MSGMHHLRNDFPLLKEKHKGLSICYLDNASTTQKPDVVLRAMDDFYKKYCANVHRGAYMLSERATHLYESARERVRCFIGAKSAAEVVFTKNATEAVNLVAGSFGESVLNPDDEVLVSALEHHANFIPWQRVASKQGAKFREIPLLPSFEVDLEGYKKLLSPKTKIVAITAASNVLGIRPPVKQMIEMAHAVGAKVLVDGCQWSSHYKTDVQEWDADFFVLTGHKLFGPTGIGILYGKEELLKSMPPYQSGGGIIERVTFERTTYRLPPERFEAGTPPIAEAVGLHHALDYLDALGWPALEEHEDRLVEAARAGLEELPYIQLLTNVKKVSPVISFTMEGVHPHDLSTFMDTRAIAVRSGHHCAQPLMDRLGVTATVRASFAFYNTLEEVDHFVKSLREAYEFFN